MSLPALALTPTERRILEWIRAHPGQSRADIARIVKVSKAMLSKAVGRFLDHGLVTERREDAPAQGRGQPALLLKTVPNAVIGIGVELTTRGLDVAALNLDCGVLVRDVAPPPADFDPPVVIADVEAAIDRVLAKAGGRRTMIAGIGIGFLYFVFEGLTLTVGEAGLLPAAVAGWAPPAALALVAASIAVQFERRRPSRSAPT